MVETATLSLIMSSYKKENLIIDKKGNQLKRCCFIETRWKRAHKIKFSCHFREICVKWRSSIYSLALGHSSRNYNELIGTDPENGDDTDHGVLFRLARVLRKVLDIRGDWTDTSSKKKISLSLFWPSFQLRINARKSFL